ncbi:hypothetical protein KJI95_02890 [Shewanella sp. JM162201]|uniref:Uncharacterized protein n=1 Tax=Shewanella jiangmenensis TaxID=2837387 RepID=A0ABS5V128_9GAMM|nr:hypothetical protein [Shewanella jiangmenensis]MBT1443471.1 hypothetical protein [Shewanella jiangmenensis]
MLEKPYSCSACAVPADTAARVAAATAIILTFFIINPIYWCLLPFDSVFVLPAYFTLAVLKHNGFGAYREHKILICEQSRKPTPKPS